ncbi:MAG: fasciclin domain-containing protein [Bacteroidota bacterium]
MNLLKKFPAFLFASILAFGFVACESDDVDDMVTADKDKTLTEYISGDSDFSTLSSALERTGLDAVLNDEDADFTLFAPNNAAFTRLGVDLATLSDDDLKDILMYHVIMDDQIRGNDLVFENRYYESASTAGVNGTNLSIMLDREDDQLMVNGIVAVSSTPNDFKNGVIYELNDVLSLPTVADIAINDENLSSLETALTDATGDLVNLLSGTTVYTVFAPINDAFEDDEETLATLNAEQLANILSYHVVAGNVVSDDLEDDQVVATLTGEEITIDIDLGIVRIQDAEGNKTLVNIRDIQTTNGVVHIIDDILMPSEF